MVALDSADIGARARVIRRRRGMSLDATAGLAGISKSYLSMLETGARRFERRGLLEDLAGALGCSVVDLTGQPYLPIDRASADALAAVPGIRSALHEYGPDDVPDVPSRSLDELTLWASDALEQCGQARYSVAGRDIGTLLTSLQAHATTATGSDRDRAFTGVVTACFSAGVVASRTGHIDLAVAAARRGVDLARRHDNPGLIGFACWYWALELTSVAARARAQAVLADAIDGLAPSTRWGHSADSRPAEVIGMMQLQQARAVARERRVDDAHAHLCEAATLAARLGERNGFRQHFGPTNVAAWRVSIGIELGEGVRAYEEAIRAQIDVAALGSAERSSSLHLDLARALVQDGGTRDGEAIRYLDSADRIAPQRIRNDPIARELVTTLDRRARRRVWELDSLKNRFGIGGRQIHRA
ncbi:MAG: helix-turn-helix transcriptional regulator [Actinomycetota bacterium]|nr:helix-turn-helix transcriptional regulator [Actinomycetota bacterium]